VSFGNSSFAGTISREYSLQTSRYNKFEALSIAGGGYQVPTSQFCQRHRKHMVGGSTHPSFVLGVIHTLLCTAEASPNVFKRLLQWENRTRQVFCLKSPPVCREDLTRAGINPSGELSNVELHAVLDIVLC
jgi:hypothetical protein